MIGSYPRTKAIMDERRIRAEEVQARSAGVTPQEQLAKLDRAKLTATKERNKLARKLAKLEEEATVQKSKKTKS